MLNKESANEKEKKGKLKSWTAWMISYRRSCQSLQQRLKDTLSSYS